jgi:ATP-dependent 26S proteasome regulatory subunit
MEMKMPDAEARGRILDRVTAALPEELRDIDRASIVGLTEGFTGADVKRLVEDAKSLFAFDRVQQSTLRPATEYFAEAAAGVRENKQRYQAAEEAARALPQKQSRGQYYEPPPDCDDD